MHMVKEVGPFIIIITKSFIFDSNGVSIPSELRFQQQCLSIFSVSMGFGCFCSVRKRNSTANSIGLLSIPSKRIVNLQNIIRKYLNLSIAIEVR